MIWLLAGGVVGVAVAGTFVGICVRVAVGTGVPVGTGVLVGTAVGVRVGAGGNGVSVENTAPPSRLASWAVPALSALVDPVPSSKCQLPTRPVCGPLSSVWKLL